MLEGAAQLYRMLEKADLDGAEKVVFGPRTWATSTGATSFALKLDRVREWTAQYMGPLATSPTVTR